MKKLKTLRNDLQLISKMGIIDWKQPSFYNLQTFAFEHIVYQFNNTSLYKGSKKNVELCGKDTYCDGRTS